VISTSFPDSCNYGGVSNVKYIYIPRKIYVLSGTRAPLVSALGYVIIYPPGSSLGGCFN
jgi:hypothetical protein